MDGFIVSIIIAASLWFIDLVIINFVIGILNYLCWWRKWVAPSIVEEKAETQVGMLTETEETTVLDLEAIRRQESDGFIERMLSGKQSSIDLELSQILLPVK